MEAQSCLTGSFYFKISFRETLSVRKSRNGRKKVIRFFNK